MIIRPFPSTRALLIGGLALGVAIASACFATQSPAFVASAITPAPGFLRGFWHGFIAPISFIVSLFSDHVRIYALPNSGRWYDFGFMLGISGFSGGLFAGSRTNKGSRS